MQVLLLNDQAKAPTKGTPDSAGFDIYALNDTTITGGHGVTPVRTGISLQMPPGTYGRIAMRSSLARDQHLSITAGVIDIDYIGEIIVLTYCTKLNHTFTIPAGSRFAQIIPEKIHYSPSCTIVSTFQKKYANHDGFGSTGNK